MNAAPISGPSSLTIRDLPPTAGIAPSVEKPIAPPIRPDTGTGAPFSTRSAPTLAPSLPTATTLSQFLSQCNIEVGLHTELLQHLTSLALAANLDDPRCFNRWLKDVLNSMTRRHASQNAKRKKHQNAGEGIDADEENTALSTAIRILENNAALRKNYHAYRNAYHQG